MRRKPQRLDQHGREFIPVVHHAGTCKAKRGSAKESSWRDSLLPWGHQGWRWGQVQYRVCHSKFFFFLWTYEQPVEAREDPNGLGCRGGPAEKRCRARAEQVQSGQSLQGGAGRWGRTGQRRRKGLMLRSFEEPG